LSCNRIKFESENYFFFLNDLAPKPEYQSAGDISKIAQELSDFFKFRVTEIVACDSTGKPYINYRYDYSKQLPPDKDRMCLRRIVHNEFRYQRILYAEGDSIPPSDKDMQDILNKFFQLSTDVPISRLKTYETLMERDGTAAAISKLRKSRKYGRQFSSPHQDAYGSKIEEKLGEALRAANIDFCMQQEIFHDNKRLTVLDMYIENGNIAIFCDGFQYHYDKETVIKDRQQDRILQFLGYRVLRYTGSEIVGNLDRCISQIKMFINKFSLDNHEK
jgi:very-short-patch-repair endonuclease